jgi:hypothetical protein
LKSDIHWELESISLVGVADGSNVGVAVSVGIRVAVGETGVWVGDGVEVAVRIRVGFASTIVGALNVGGIPAPPNPGTQPAKHPKLNIINNPIDRTLSLVGIRSFIFPSLFIRLLPFR